MPTCWTVPAKATSRRDPNRSEKHSDEISTQDPATRADYIGQMLFCPALLTPRETWLRGSLREIAVIVVPCGTVELHVIVAEDGLLGAWWATADTMRNRPALVFIA
jgi:hypothetical protein